jgi:general secretion pathway protein G
MVIMGLLAGLVGPQVLKQLSSSKTKTASLQIGELAAALDLYLLEQNQYPSQEQGLLALVEAPSGLDAWHGPYLRKKQLPKDPWGREYLYRFPGEKSDFDLYSLGADGNEGGEGEAADVGNW